VRQGGPLQKHTRCVFSRFRLRKKRSILTGTFTRSYGSCSPKLYLKTYRLSLLDNCGRKRVNSWPHGQLCFVASESHASPFKSRHLMPGCRSIFVLPVTNAQRPITAAGNFSFMGFSEQTISLAFRVPDNYLKIDAQLSLQCLSKLFIGPSSVGKPGFLTVNRLSGFLPKTGSF